MRGDVISDCYKNNYTPERAMNIYATCCWGYDKFLISIHGRFFSNLDLFYNISI